jgi:DNA polymerase
MGGSELFLDLLSRAEALRLLHEAGLSGSGAPRASGAVTATGPEPRRSAPDRGDFDREAGAISRRKAPSPQGTAPPGDGGRSTPGPSVGPLPDDYDELRSIAMGCTRCALCEGRTQVVFSDGPTDARIMVVGEAPGANEDETGIPFVGAAGKYLDLLLATVGLGRTESVYIANVLKCRPPGNRDPRPEEIEACSPFLRKQIDLVRPEVLLAVGSFAGKLLTGQDKASLGRLRGEVHSYHGVPLVVTYHPAALLRNPNWTRAFWTDLQLLRDVLDADAGALGQGV